MKCPQTEINIGVNIWFSQSNKITNIFSTVNKMLSRNGIFWDHLFVMLILNQVSHSCMYLNHFNIKSLQINPLNSLSTFNWFIFIKRLHQLLLYSHLHIIYYYGATWQNFSREHDQDKNCCHAKMSKICCYSRLLFLPSSQMCVSLLIIVSLCSSDNLIQLWK